MATSRPLPPCASIDAARHRRPPLDVHVVDVPQDRLDVVLHLPSRIVDPKRAHVADPPAMVADTRYVIEAVLQGSAGDPLGDCDRLDHRAVALPTAAEVVDGRLPWRVVKGGKSSDHV